MHSDILIKQAPACLTRRYRYKIGDWYRRLNLPALPAFLAIPAHPHKSRTTVLFLPYNQRR
jgi:hypothetical protein